LYFVQVFNQTVCAYRDKKVVGVFVRFSLRRFMYTSSFLAEHLDTLIAKPTYHHRLRP
jgi:hypothetical protein